MEALAPQIISPLSPDIPLDDVPASPTLHLFTSPLPFVSSHSLTYQPDKRRSPSNGDRKWTTESY